MQTSMQYQITLRDTRPTCMEREIFRGAKFSKRMKKKQEKLSVRLAKKLAARLKEYSMKKILEIFMVIGTSGFKR